MDSHHISLHLEMLTKLTGKKGKNCWSKRKGRSKIALYGFYSMMCVNVCVRVCLKGREKASKLLRDLMKSREYVNDVS